MTPLRAILVAALLGVAVLGAPGEARAHGGEDHGAEAAPASEASAGERSATGETAAFSAALHYGAGGPARLFVADADSSAPLADAKVRLELRGGVTADLEARTTERPGVYALTLPELPEESEASATISVQKGERFDLIVLEPLRSGPLAAPAGELHEHEGPGVPRWAAGAAIGLAALLAGAAGIGLGRRRRASSGEAKRGEPDELDRAFLELEAAERGADEPPKRRRARAEREESR